MPIKKVLMLLCLLALLAGCRPAPDGTVTLIWATNSHPSRVDAARWFEKQHPGVRVEIMPMGDARQFFLKCLYGDAPDVITFFSADTFQAFAENGLLRPLSGPSRHAWPYYDALQAYCFKGKTDELMALPQVAYPYVLYFNPDLVPKDKAMAVRTWGDLLTIIRTLSPAVTDTGKPVFGLDIQNESVWFTTWYWQRGGRFFSEEGTSVLDRDIARDTLAAMACWRSLPGVIPKPSDRLNLPSSGASQGVLGSLFLQGRALFYWSGSWKIGDFEAQDRVPWQVRMLPCGPINDVTVMGGNSFGVSGRSSHPELARQFVAALGGKAAQKRHLAHRIYLPARKEIPVPQSLSILKDQAQKARCPEHSPLLNEALVKEIFKQALEAHRLGVADAQEAADMMASALEAGAVEVACD